MESSTMRPHARTMFAPPTIGRKTLWAIRVAVALIFGAWAYSNLTWPEIPAWTAIIPIGLGLVTYVVVVRTAASLSAGSGPVPGTSLWLVSDGREITRARLWLARGAIIVLALGAILQLASVSPISLAGRAAGLGIVYWAALQVLSTPSG